MLTPEDRTLIESFLDATGDLSPERAAEAIPGISGATIRRYRDGKLPSRLTSDVRIALREFLTTRDDTGSSGASFPEAEQWLQSILAPESLRRMARTVEGRQVVKGLRGIIADLDWPADKKRAADRLLSDALLDDGPPES